MNPIEQIKLCEPQFTRSDQKISQYVLEHLDVIASYPIIEIANKADVSKSALLRFCQKLGYTGFSEFKYEVSKHLLSGSFKDPNAVNGSNDIVNIYLSCISHIPSHISDGKIKELCSLIVHADKIKIYGVHESGLSANYFAFRLASLGIDAETITLPGVFNEKASFSGARDLNIFISVSGMTDCVIEAAGTSFLRKAKTAMITQNSKAKYANRYDSLLIIPSLETDKNKLFLDSQAILYICIDLIINKLAEHL
ncbi:MurR/RpiR family transcriptional regulator [Clostridium sp. KNHs216]|uniref:MurR/RpiR family transcriptional regulator n=1 Tax=Clostridium sp. KNHs216 TaxID=1550235 RepID=UPI0011690847|nr:MurR/RpiR family transcriptional regulator [Clostridium sp. KNHs216]TQI68719.1 RpiR family transcriptional regulator [Clostridium sp. KNHs216]